MSTASSTRTGAFRREPGDWTCQQCNEVNFKSRTGCRRCSTPRNQPAATNPFAAGTGTTPQIVPRQGDWTCHSCTNINFAARVACNKCGRQKQEPVVATASSSATSKPNDWICHFCHTNNFAARAACFKCNRQKQEPMDTDTRPAATPKPGDWKCPSCSDMNFGSRVVCRACGTARPSTEQSNNHKECVICMERSIDSVITSCGHSAVCLQCGTQLTQCPMCRNPFRQEQLIKLYNAH